MQKKKTCLVAGGATLLVCVGVAATLIILHVVHENKLRPSDPAFFCTSHYTIPEVTNMTRKGMCLDDVTWADCSGKITSAWPNTNHTMKTMRMFKPCVPGRCDKSSRDIDWQNLLKFVQRNNVTVMMGNIVDDPCNLKDDEEEWQLTLELLQKLCRQHVFAVAIGNELDQKMKKEYPCMPSFWKGGYIDLLKRRDADLKKIGFGDVKLTAVVTTYVIGTLSERPFRNTSDEAFATFYAQAYQTFGKNRWAWSFNVYPFWNAGSCGSYDINATRRFNELPAILAIMRQSMTTITGNKDDTFWMTETGWQSDASSGRGDLCPGKPYSSLQNMRLFYTKFLQWNLSIGEGLQPPDLVFYFTMRDVSSSGETFGLMESCSSTECKIQSNHLDDGNLLIA